MPDKMKTLLVGLDAACWPYLDPLIQTGKVPTLQRLMEKGSWGTLRSTMPAWTPTAWSTIVTGKNPGKHGVFDMLTRKSGTYDFSPTNARSRIGKPFWKRLNERGWHVGLVNVPFTYPIDPVDGFAICGFGTPNSVADFAYPDDVLTMLKSQPEGFQPVVDPDLLEHGAPEEVFTAEVRLQSAQIQAALRFAEKYEVDVLTINLMLPDHANHKMPQMAQVHQAICQSDSDLKLLLEGFAPDHIMLISDHGSSRVRGNFLLQAWLRDQGYYVQARRPLSERDGALNWIIMQYLRQHLGWSGLGEKLVRRLVRLFVPHLPRSMENVFWNRISEIIPFAREHFELANKPDFARTPLFPASIFSGLFYLNLLGRDPSGVVSPEEKSELLAELVSKLSQIVDPDTGLPLFAHIYTVEEIYQGPATAHAPDLILDSFGSSWNIQLSGYVPVVDEVHRGYFVSGKDYGWHSRDGIFVFAGPAFGTGSLQARVQLEDIAPTLLYLHDVAVPEDYDGRILTELFEPQFIEKQPVRSQTGDTEATAMPEEHTYADEETEELLGHLRALGYVE